MSHPQMPLTIKHIGDNLACLAELKKGQKSLFPSTTQSGIRHKSMARSIASVFMFLIFQLIIQRASGSSCEVDPGKSQSDRTGFKVVNDGGGDLKLSLKEMEAKVDQAVAGVNREVG